MTVTDSFLTINDIFYESSFIQFLSVDQRSSDIERFLNLEEIVNVINRYVTKLCWTLYTSNKQA